MSPRPPSAGDLPFRAGKKQLILRVNFWLMAARSLGAKAATPAAFREMREYIFADACGG